jgi:hypothetical protein
MFGHNETKSAPTAGTAGGAGIFGLTAAPGSRGGPVGLAAH